MTTLLRLLLLVCGIVLVTAPGYTQDSGRRPPDAPPIPSVPEMPRRGGPGGPGRGLIEPPRSLGPLPGWTQDSFQKNVELGPRAIFELSNSLGEVRITGIDGNFKVIRAPEQRTQLPGRRLGVSGHDPRHLVGARADRNWAGC